MRCSNCSAVMVSMEGAFHCHNCGNFIVRQPAEPTMRDVQCVSSRQLPVQSEAELLLYIAGRKYHCVLCEDLQTQVALKGLIALEEYDGMICAGVEDMLTRFRMISSQDSGMRNV